MRQPLSRRLIPAMQPLAKLVPAFSKASEGCSVHQADLQLRPACAARQGTCWATRPATLMQSGSTQSCSQQP